MGFLLALIINALILYGSAMIFSGITVDSYLDAVLVILVLTVVNFFIRPVLVFLTLPVTILTLGLFLLVINAAMILLTDWLLTDFYVDGWFWALVLSLILSIFSLAVNRQRHGARVE